jgi:CoA binding protein
MTEAELILDQCASVLVVDWPSRDVPETLANAGYSVVVQGGPRSVGRPEQVDLVYVHRPFDELPGIVALAKASGAKAVWWQSGLTSAGAKDPKGSWISEHVSRQARELVESAGLRYIDDVYIADAVRLRQACRAEVVRE